MNVLDREGLRQVIVSICDLPDGAVFWEIDSNPSFSDSVRAQVMLELVKMSALGVDEHRNAVSDGSDGYPPGSYVTTEIGNREMIITIKVEALDKGVEAAEIIDFIRTGIRKDSTVVSLNALNLAYVWSTQAIRVPNRIDTRALNTAVADFEFAGIAKQVHFIPPDVGGDYINTVNTTNQVDGTLNP